MAHIQKRTFPSGNTTCRVRIRLRGAPEISESFHIRREAKEWSSKMEADIRQGRYFGKTNSTEHTFAELVDRYLEWALQHNAKSYSKYRTQLLWWKGHLKALLHNPDPA